MAVHTQVFRYVWVYLSEVIYDAIVFHFSASPRSPQGCVVFLDLWKHAQGSMYAVVTSESCGHCTFFCCDHCIHGFLRKRKHRTNYTVCSFSCAYTNFHDCFTLLNGPSHFMLCRRGFPLALAIGVLVLAGMFQNPFPASLSVF